MHAGADAHTHTHTDKIHALFVDAGIKMHRVSQLFLAALALFLCTSTSAARLIKSQFQYQLLQFIQSAVKLTLKKKKKEKGCS